MGQRIKTMARLIISSPDGKGGILELTKPLVTLGRGVANDLVLKDGSVSRLHAVVKQEKGKITIADRGSTNGVLVNGVRIATETALRHGDLARVGRFNLTLESQEETNLVMQAAKIPAALNAVMRGESESIEAASRGMSAGGSPSGAGERAKKLERENYLLRVLYDAGKALNAKLSVDDIAAQVMSLVFRIDAVERGFLMFFDDKGNPARQTEVRYRRPPTGAQPQIIFSRSVMETVRTQMQPLLIMNAANDARFSASESMR